MRAAEELPADAGAGSENGRCGRAFERAKAGRAWAGRWEKRLGFEGRVSPLLLFLVSARVLCSVCFFPVKIQLTAQGSVLFLV